MKLKTIMLLILLIVTTAIKSNCQDYNIFLKIDGIEYDSAVIGFSSVQNDDDEIEDVGIISNGVLKYKFDAKGLHEAVIIPYKLISKFGGGASYPLPNARIHFYINNGEVININATVKDKIVTYVITGNELSKQGAEADVYIRNSGIYKDRIEFEHHFHSKNYDDWTKEENKVYWEKRNKNDSLYLLKCEEFILGHLNYEYSPRLILEIKDKQKATILYNKLTTEAKNSYFGQKLANLINGWAITTPGALFPNFSAKTVSGDDFNLQEHKGKYVLLDFWGSWCAPCIMEIPDLKKLQNDFKKKLVIVGLVCDDSREKINNAIKKHDIDWVQLFDDENRFPTTYGIKSFPTKVLIDDKGIVVKTIEGASEQIIAELRGVLE